MMIFHKQTTVPRQQPTERHYYRERSSYNRHELDDVRKGGDYNYTAPAGMPNSYGNHNMNRGESYYSNDRNSYNNTESADYRFGRARRNAPPDTRYYTPSRDYGYERDEYYPMDSAYESSRHGEATGYGNDRSVQGRDFERWLHSPDTYSPSENRNYIGHKFPHQHHTPDDRGFEEGLYEDYDRRNVHYGREREHPRRRGSR